MNRKPFVRVRKPLRSSPWCVYCDACTTPILGISFTPLRTSTDFVLAVAWATQHARKHAEQMCPVCEHAEPITDDSRTVTL